MNKLLLLKRTFVLLTVFTAVFLVAKVIKPTQIVTRAEEPVITQSAAEAKVDTLPDSYAETEGITIYDFNISIPKINLKHDIKYNVDPRDKSIYLPVLDEYVAHGMFTAIPSTEKGRVYLYAHSKKAPKNVTPEGGYFSHIHELKKGDKIYVTLNEDLYTYVVRERIIVEPTQIDVYTGKSERTEIALQTCYPPGTTEDRLILFADLESVK